MKVFYDINHVHLNCSTILTIGTFDGVHLGHQTLLQELKLTAQKYPNAESALLTFSPHPRLVLYPEDTQLELLTTDEEKVSLLNAQNISNLFIVPFDKAFSRLTAEEYVKQILVDKLKVAELIIGHDHHFGRNRTGNFDELIKLGKKYGFNVSQIPPKQIEGITISSTKIRKLLHEGNVHLANTYLNYEYSIKGKVVEGKKIGRQLGFPTANIQINSPNKLIPKDGVYAVLVEIGTEKPFKGMLNIGFNPSINAPNAQQKIEVHIFDFNNNIYGESIRIKFVERMRSEQHFVNKTLLKYQLEQDATLAKKILG